MIIQGQVGEQTLTDSSNPVVIRMGKGGEQLFSRLQADHYEQTYRGKRYSVASQAAVSTTAGLATTFTGLVLGNPASSPVNLVIENFAVSQFAAGVAGAVGIMGGASTTAITGTLAIQNRKMGQAAGYAVASAGQTIGTPILLDTFGAVGSLATTGYGLVQGIFVCLNGSLIVPPGYFVASYTTAATTSALGFKFGWSEIPI